MTRGKGFYINGYSSNHYPDFIIYTKKNNLILLETKGDHLLNEESQEKNRLGKLYIDKAGSNYKYFMVFEKATVQGCYNEGNIVEVLRRL